MRYLFVPAPTAFADEYLAPSRRSGECLCLGADIPFRSDDTWDALVSRFPAGWQPDVIVVWMPDPHVPDCIWSAPIPVLGLAASWVVRGHHYRHLLPLFDGIFAPPPCLAALANQGYGSVAVADFAGLGESAFLTRIPDDADRDLDVLVLDPLNLPEPASRNRYAGRIAELADLYRVEIHRPTTQEAGRALMLRAKLVLILPSPTGEDRMSYEALAAGALPVRPRYPWDGADWLRPDVDYAAYQELNLEQVVLTLLGQDEDRRALLRNGRSRLREFHFANRLTRALSGLQPNFGELENHAKERAKRKPVLGLGGRIWANLAGGAPVELPPPGSEEEPAEVTVVRGVLSSNVQDAISHFQRALEREPDHPVARANLAEALADAGQTNEAIVAAHAALAQLDRTAMRPIIGWDVPLYPVHGEASDQWEVAAWSTNPTLEANTKRQILRWKLQLLLAAVTKELPHYHEAVLARPDWPTGRAALGCAFARLGRPHEALHHLAMAVDADPFDRPAARALFGVLQETDDTLGMRLFTRRNRRLAKADPVGCPVEAWFAEPTPVGDELASIIIVDTQPEPPRACLEAVLRFTRPPFQVLIVGPGDTDWLRDYRSPHTSALRVAANLSSMEMVNRGISQANGEFLAILDSRTVVSAHWLDRLLSRLCEGWPRVAAVGPKFATSFAPQNQPQKPTAWAPRLAWECLVSHRAIWERIGGFDPALAGFASDDWCARARENGFALAVGADVSVQATETPGTVSEFESFVGRWGQREGAAYVPSETGWSRRPTISACLIVRNEERYLADCLESVADLVDDLVVVDTGSTDRTKEIATSFGARVFDFPWVDSFAAARNESLRHATGDWIFWLDADDRLSEVDRNAFRNLTASLSFAPAAYVFKCICPHDDTGAAATVVDHVRFFRNDPRLRWTYRVHEQILPSIRKLAMPVKWSSVTVRHVGYAEAGSREKKFERDMRLLQLEDRENPNEPFTQFNLGSLFAEIGQHTQAIQHFNRSLELSGPTDSIVRKLYAQLARCHRLLGNSQAARATATTGLQQFPNDAELLTVSANLHEELEDWSAAVACWQRLVEGRDDDHFASVPSDLRGEQARQRLVAAQEHQERSRREREVPRPTMG